MKRSKANSLNRVDHIKTLRDTAIWILPQLITVALVFLEELQGKFEITGGATVCVLLSVGIAYLKRYKTNYSK